MTDEPFELPELDDEEETATPAKGSAIKTILFGVVGALVLGGVAAGVTFIIPTGDTQCVVADASAGAHQPLIKDYHDIQFVNLDPLVITLGPNAKSEYLKISVSLETTKDHVKDAEHLRPRFRDVLNMYLRAVDEKDLVEPFAMTRLRAQMLRRMQVVASADVVSDVLITEFVLN